MYERLDAVKDLEGRREIISEYLRWSGKVPRLLPDEARLTNEMSIPFEDDGISFPFVVGHKYSQDEPYGNEPCFAYVVGIVRTPESVELLITSPRGEGDVDEVYSYPRSWMNPPEWMLPRERILEEM